MTRTIAHGSAVSAPGSPRQVARAGGLHPAGEFILLAGAFLPIMDFFITNVALPSIDASLHASSGALELVIAGYGVAYAALLVLGGRLETVSVGTSSFWARSSGSSSCRWPAGSPPPLTG